MREDKRLRIRKSVAELLVFKNLTGEASIEAPVAFVSAATCKERIQVRRHAAPDA
jgi:hypothetical protein